MLAKEDLTPTTPAWSCESGQGPHEGLLCVIGSTGGNGNFKGSKWRKYGIDGGQLGIMDARLA